MRLTVGPLAGRSLDLPDNPSFLVEIVAETFPAVLVIMAVDAEILPVRAVRGVIPGIPVFVVYR